MLEQEILNRLENIENMLKDISPQNELLTLSQAAKLLGVSRNTVLNYAAVYGLIVNNAKGHKIYSRERIMELKKLRRR